MPTVRIFGQEVEKKKLLIGGGLLAAAVAVIVFLRARAAGASAQQAAPAPQEDAGYGGGMSVAAPSGQVASAYEQQMQNSELEASAIANKYQANLVTQQEKQFDFQQRMQDLLAPDILANERSELAVETHQNKTVAKTRIACPAGQALKGDPGNPGGLYCAGKGSGLPVISDLWRSVQGLGRGVAAASPEIGYEASKSAASYYTGKVFGPSKVVTGKRKDQVGTPPIAPVMMSGHGYEDHIG